MRTTPVPFALVLLIWLASLSNALAADVALQPFVLASQTQTSLDEAARQAVEKLQAAGLQVVGSYQPFGGAQVISVSNDTLRQAAGKTPRGGFAAAINVGLTQVDDKVQVAYQNPAYLAAAYRLDSDLGQVLAALNKALGFQSRFGAKGLTRAKLSKYHYMLGMETFEDASKLGVFASHEAAVSAVESALKAGKLGAGQVFRVDLPGGQQSLFGVSAVKSKDSRVTEQRIIHEVVDAKADLKTTAYLPQLVLVDGQQVLAPHLRFALAVWHPDLTMGTFGKLISSPGAIESWLKKVVAAP